jgi:hypothetical protein
LKRLVIIVVLGLCTVAASAQSTRVVVESAIERDVSMYRWLFGGSVSHSMGPWTIEAENAYMSDAFILFEDRLRFRDENRLRWRVGRPMSGTLRSVSEGRLTYFSQSRVLIQQALSGVEYRHSDRFVVRPSVGVALDQRPGAALPGVIPALRTDAGPAFALSFSALPRVTDDARVSLAGDASYNSIRPREGRTIRLIGSAEGRFEETRLDGRLSYGGARRDVYQSASFLNRGLPTNEFSETIEAATTDTTLAGLTLRTPIGGGLAVVASVDGTLSRRLIRTHRAPQETLYFDTDFERRAVDVDLRLTLTRPGTDAFASLQIGADTETRRLANRDRLPPTQAAQKSALLQQADYDRSLLAVRTSARHAFAEGHAARLETLVSIVRRDTPAINLDDRDEAYHSVSAGLETRWSRYLSTDLAMFASYYHTVYLNAARSAENNVQRSLRLRPTIRLTPSETTRFQLSSEVRATYTVDDFQIEGRRPNDQAAREMRFDVDLEQDLGYGLRVLGRAGYNDLRLGRLLWSDFAEIPFDTLRTYTGWLRLQAGSRIVSEIGVRAYVRTSYSRNVVIRYASPADGSAAIISRAGREWITQIGPTSSITMRLGERSELTFNGWLNLQRVYHDLYGPLPETDVHVVRQSARSGSRLVVPNLALHVRWHL